MSSKFKLSRNEEKVLLVARLKDKGMSYDELREFFVDMPRGDLNVAVLGLLKYNILKLKAGLLVYTNNIEELA